MVTAELKKLPEEGEIVIVTVKEITGHGAYVRLDEYSNLTGFLHISEIATGWIRNIERYVKPKQKAVLKVIRVNKNRSEVDLSLKQVSGEERKSKLIEVKKNEKATAFMEMVKVKANLTDNQVHEIEDKILQKYDYLYDFFETVAKKGIDSARNLGLSPEVLTAVEDESNKIQVPHVEIRGILEISSKDPNGIEVIKGILSPLQTSKSNVKVNISYIVAPKYRIVVRAENFKIAEKTMNNILEKIRSSIDKYQGKFNFSRETSKKSHQ
jgi:translation initiation factor 2 subunit 1